MQKIRHVPYQKMEAHMDRLEAMSVLLAVVEARSLSGAGRKLSVPLSTISRKIADLENHLGARLLIRSSRQVELTTAGHAFVAASRRILEQMVDAERVAAGEFTAAKGELVLTAPVVFGQLHIVPIVAAFLGMYPQISIRLILADRILNLFDDHVDVALRIGSLPDSSLMATKVGAVRRVICASPGYLRACGVPQSPQDLTQHACISFSMLAPRDHWTFSSASGDLSVTVTSRLVVTTAQAAIDAAVLGLGLTRILSYQIAAPLQGGLLTTVLDDWAGQMIPVSLVYSGQGALPQKLRAFLDYAVPQLKQRLKHA
jgi:DNA-binding transcriptional LysR family regulator